MKKPINILEHLREKEFDESELLREMEDMVDINRDQAANESLFQYQNYMKRFKDRRDKRLDREFDLIMQDNNDVRLQNKLARAQEVYKSNRKSKKARYRANKKNAK